MRNDYCTEVLLTNYNIILAHNNHYNKHYSEYNIQQLKLSYTVKNISDGIHCKYCDNIAHKLIYSKFYDRHMPFCQYCLQVVTCIRDNKYKNIITGLRIYNISDNEIGLSVNGSEIIIYYCKNVSLDIFSPNIKPYTIISNYKTRLCKYLFLLGELLILDIRQYIIRLMITARIKIF